MGEIVYIQNDRVVTDSLMVAEVFGKRHDNVIADIRNQIKKLEQANECDFISLNFKECDYINDSATGINKNRKYKKYLLTEDAFTLVTMAYTTIESMKFKVRYINEFNRMKQMLGNRNSKLPSSFAEALRLAAEVEEERERLHKENLILLPKAQGYDQIANADNFVAVNKIAKNIGIGEKKFFEFLRATKIFFREGDANLPMQQYQNCNYFTVKVKTVDNGYGKTFTQYTTKVTGKGELFLLKQVNKYGGAEVINKLKLRDIKDYVKNHKKELQTV